MNKAKWLLSVTMTSVLLSHPSIKPNLTLTKRSSTASRTTASFEVSHAYGENLRHISLWVSFVRVGDVGYDTSIDEKKYILQGTRSSKPPVQESAFLIQALFVKTF